MYKFSRGITNLIDYSDSIVDISIDIEIFKILRLEGITLKSGHDFIYKGSANKKNEVTSSTGSKYRSVRHINATPFYPAGFIIKSSINNIHSTSEDDMFSGFDKKPLFNEGSIQTKEEIRQYLTNCEKLHKDNIKFSGEVILNKITPSNVAGIFYTHGIYSCYKDPVSLLQHKVQAYVMQEKWQQYTGVSLPIINHETGKEVSKEDLKKKIMEDIKSIDLQSMQPILHIAAQSSSLFYGINEATNNFTYSKQGYQKPSGKGKELWDEFAERYEKTCKKNAQLKQSFERRGLDWCKQSVNLYNLNSITKPLNTFNTEEYKNTKDATPKQIKTLNAKEETNKLVLTRF